MRRTRTVALFLSVSTAGATLPGCATMGAPQARVASLDGSIGELGARTSFEIDPGGATAPTDGNDRAKKRAPSESVFWAGIIVGSIATAAAIGTGIGAIVTENQIEDGYRQGISSGELDDLEGRGNVLGATSVTGFSLGVAGFLTSIIVYGVDYTRCGPLVQKRRDCDRN